MNGHYYLFYFNSMIIKWGKSSLFKPKSYREGTVLDKIINDIYDDEIVVIVKQFKCFLNFLKQWNKWDTGRYASHLGQWGGSF